MSANLDTLKNEIQEYLAREGFNVFHGHSRGADSLPMVYWDCEAHPDYREFLDVARTAGVGLIVFHQRELSAEMIDDALDRLEAAPMNRDDYRLTEDRLEELRRYEGFTCAIELSFDYSGRVYVFERRTPWFDELADIMDEMDFGGGDGEDGGEDPMGGYFSKN